MQFTIDDKEIEAILLRISYQTGSQMNAILPYVRTCSPKRGFCFRKSGVKFAASS